jgi:HAE1 family hydrophobic/amphiphilic exporter-1
MPKDASLEQTNFMTQKQKPLDKEDFVHSQFTIVGQTSGGMGLHNQLLTNQRLTKMVELDQRDEPANVYAAKPNVN